MFKVSVDYSDLVDTLYDKMEGMAQVASSRNQEHMAKAVFTISATEFTKKMESMALATPKALHHVYEWGQIGNSRYRLFEIRRAQVGGGNLYVTAYFLPSKKIVPIAPELKVRGRRGRTVKAKHIFRDKAYVMELGAPTRYFSAKNTKALAFWSKRQKKIIFIKNPGVVSIKNPGGRYTTGAFTRKFANWFENPKNINAAIRKSGFDKALETGLVKALSMTKRASVTHVNKTISEVSARYSKGATII